MSQPHSFARVWVTGFLIGLAADAVVVAVLWVMARYGGLGDVRLPWLVGVILLAGTALFATRRAIQSQPARETPPPIAVATVSTPVPRVPRPSFAVEADAGRGPSASRGTTPDAAFSHAEPRARDTRKGR